jgi:hypothetical protein
VLTFANTTFDTMEDGPRNTVAETDSSTDIETSTSSTAKKKKATRLASYIVEPKKETTPLVTEKREDFWKRIVGNKSPKGPVEAQSEAMGTSASEQTLRLKDLSAEADESEAPLEILSEPEISASRQAIAQQLKQELAEEAIHADAQDVLLELAVANAFAEHLLEAGDLAAATEATEAAFNLLDEDALIEAAAASDESGEAELQDTTTTAASAAAKIPPSVPRPVPSNTLPKPPITTNGAPNATIPPSGPAGPVPLWGTPVPNPGMPAQPQFNVAPSTANQLATTTMVSAEDAHYYERKALQRGLLVGGIVGYLFGRRRGRIKAEKRFAPVQKKLEKQVSRLEAEVYETHDQLRSQAAAQIRSTRRQQPAEQLVASTTQVEQIRQTRLPEQRQPNYTEQISKQVPERIGRVLVRRTETVFTSETAVATERQPVVNKELLSAEKRVQSMTRRELLAASETIIIEGANLRQIYETHLVGEQALRRIVAEHLRGGDVQKVLREELVEREIDFERDPVLRDRARAALSGGGNSALDNLLQKAGVTNDEDQSTLVASKSEEKSAKYKKPMLVKHHLVDASIGIVITVLAAAVLIIYLHTR